VIAHPLYEQTALFLKFARLPVTTTEKPPGFITHTASDEKAIISFANAFGPLGRGILTMRGKTQVEVPGTMQGLGLIKAEPLSRWAAEVFRMRVLLELWNTLRDDGPGRDEALAKAIRWNADGVQYVGPLGPQLIADRRMNPETLAAFKPGHLIAPAWRFLHTAINTELKKHALRAVLAGQDEARPYLAGQDEARLYLVPESLLGALWYQFAAAVAHNKHFRQCEQCGRWFEPGRDTRGDAKFCKPPCRMKFYRNKKQQARDLRAKGTPLKEIAKQLNSDIQTVKGWVKK